MEQERLLNKATNQWGYGRGPVLGIFHGLNTAQKFNTELALTSLRSAIGNPENIVVEKRSTISAGLYAIELQFENPASISRDELIAINASLQANFLAKLEGEHKFSLSINNNSNTYKETSSNELLVNNISIHINEAVHSNKWSEVSFDEAINAALKTLEELKLINDAAKNKVENEIYGEQPQASFQLS
ncbi:MAG: hypothetical protein HWD59_06305 [Coxiellaceae bacterium]|nr:MAG: hypothetical protein HWD59_06305 [Coxiellaceae bacterium]